MKLYTFIFSLSVILLLAYAVFLGIKFASVPEIIPIHYSSEGPDGFGSKMFLWLEAGINAVILILTGLPLFYPQKIFKKNNNHLEPSAETAIKNRQIFLSVLSLAVTLLLCGLSLKEII
ncbi:DUF1648 domain-containing protein [Chryseobacterium gregarium]|uniref:DUF1648 domain-containing protein n=1 Tax=Chryseobacterium gregarium TaxID=456299 RepID=UPI0003F58790|nr:DUF1648 domain-containing protein [Chryseobacterium gregarium]